MNTFGHNFRLSIWGESHGQQVGIVIDGVPAGIELASADFETDLARRRGGATGGDADAGGHLGITPRREPDVARLAAGIHNGRTTGAPLVITFDNTDARSEDYGAAGIAPNSCAPHFRPSHADRTAHCKFGGFNDPRGGGHFSGRLTVALVAAAVVAKKMLTGMSFTTRVTQIGPSMDPACFDEVLRDAAGRGDSLGGVVECRIQGVPQGLGEPFFDSVESLAAHLLFAIPGVKGVEFGSGFASSRMSGSENNDPIVDAAGRTATNHDGGINGGITNGNEIVVRAAFKPTPSIACEQMTYNPTSGRVESLTVAGRHDTCIALRGAVVVEAAMAIVLADLI